MSGRAYKEISRLGQQLRTDKVRERRQAGEELIRKLSDSKTRSRLAEEAYNTGSRVNGSQALCSIWRILINNALAATQQVISSDTKKRRTKPIKEDLELPYRLLMLCDGSIKDHNDPSVLVVGQGSKMSRNEINDLLTYCLDTLNNDIAMSIAEKEILAMFGYLLSSPHYVAHFRPLYSTINDCLAEINKYLTSSTSSSEHLSLIATAFSGLMRVCTCILGIGMHSYISPCIEMISQWCYDQSQNQSTYSSSSPSSHATLDTIQKLYTVVTNLMAAHPEEAVSCMESHGKHLLVFARKCFASTSHIGIHKEHLTDYFSAHLLLCEVAGKLDGLLYDDLSNRLGSATLDKTELHILLNVVATRNQIEKVCCTSNSSNKKTESTSVTSSRSTFLLHRRKLPPQSSYNSSTSLFQTKSPFHYHYQQQRHNHSQRQRKKSRQHQTFPIWEPLQKRQRRHLELCARLLKHSQRLFVAQAELNTCDDPTSFILGDSSNDSSSSSSHKNISSRIDYSKSPWVLFVAQYLYEYCPKSNSRTDSPGQQQNNTSQQMIDEYLSILFANLKSNSNTGPPNQSLDSITPILQLICACAEAFPNGECWMMSSDWIQRNDPNHAVLSDEVGCSIIDLTVLIYMVSNILILSGNATNGGNPSVQMWCLMALLKLSSTSLLICDRYSCHRLRNTQDGDNDSHDKDTPTIFHILEYVWRYHVWQTLFRTDLRYISYTASTNPDSIGELVLLLLTQMIHHGCIFPQRKISYISREEVTATIPKTSDYHHNDGASQWLISQQSKIFMLPVFKKPQNIESSTVFGLITTILHRLGLSEEGKDILGDEFNDTTIDQLSMSENDLKRETSLQNSGRRYRLVCFCLNFLYSVDSKNRIAIAPDIVPMASMCLSALISGEIVPLYMKSDKNSYFCTEDSFFINGFNIELKAEKTVSKLDSFRETIHSIIWKSNLCPIHAVHKMDDDEHIWRIIEQKGLRLFYPNIKTIQRLHFIFQHLNGNFKSDFVSCTTMNLLRCFTLEIIEHRIMANSLPSTTYIQQSMEEPNEFDVTKTSIWSRLFWLSVMIEIFLSGQGIDFAWDVISPLSQIFTSVFKDAIDALPLLTIDQELFLESVTYIEAIFRACAKMVVIEKSMKIPKFLGESASSVYEIMKKIIESYSKRSPSTSISDSHPNSFSSNKTPNHTQNEENIFDSDDAHEKKEIEEYSSVEEKSSNENSDSSYEISGKRDKKRKRMKQRKSPARKRLLSMSPSETSNRSTYKIKNRQGYVPPDHRGVRKCAHIMAILNPSADCLSLIAESLFWLEGSHVDADPFDAVFCLDLFCSELAILRQKRIEEIQQKQTLAPLIKTDDLRKSEREVVSLCLDLLHDLRCTFGPSSVYCMWGFKLCAKLIEMEYADGKYNSDLGYEEISMILHPAKSKSMVKDYLVLSKRCLKSKPTLKKSQLKAVTHAFSHAFVFEEEFGGSFVMAPLTDLDHGVRMIATEAVEAVLKRFEHQRNVVDSILRTLPPLSNIIDNGSLKQPTLEQWVLDRVDGLPEVLNMQGLHKYTKTSFQMTAIHCIGKIAGSTLDPMIAREQILYLIFLSADQPNLQMLCFHVCEEAATLMGFRSLGQLMENFSEWFLHHWIMSGRELRSIPLLMSSPYALSRLLVHAQGNNFNYYFERKIKHGSTLKERNIDVNENAPKSLNEDSDLLDICVYGEDVLFEYITKAAPNLIPVILLTAEFKLGDPESRNKHTFARDSISERHWKYLHEASIILTNATDEENILKVLRCHIHDIYAYLCPMLQNVCTHPSLKAKGIAVQTFLQSVFQENTLKKRLLYNADSTILQILRLSACQVEAHCFETEALEQEAYIQAVHFFSQIVQINATGDSFRDAGSSITLCLLRTKKWLSKCVTKEEKLKIWGIISLVINEMLRMVQEGVNKEEIQLGFCIHTILKLIMDRTFSSLRIDAVQRLKHILMIGFEKISNVKSEIAAVLHNVVTTLLQLHENAKQQYISLHLESQWREESSLRQCIGITVTLEDTSETIRREQNFDTTKLSRSLADSFDEAAKMMRITYDVLELVLISSPSDLEETLCMLDPFPVSSISTASTFSDDDNKKFSLKSLLQRYFDRFFQGAEIGTLHKEIERFLLNISRNAKSSTDFGALHSSRKKGETDKTQDSCISSQSQLSSLNHLVKVVRFYHDEITNLTDVELQKVAVQLRILCDSQSNEVSFAANRCLGELCHTISLASSCFPNTDMMADKSFPRTQDQIIDENPLLQIQTNALEKLSHYILSADSDISLVAGETAQALLNTKEGLKCWVLIKDENVKRMLAPLIPKKNSKFIKDNSSRVPESDMINFFKSVGLDRNISLKSRRWCWEKKIWTCCENDNFEKWIQNLVFAIIECCYGNSDSNKKSIDVDSIDDVQGESEFFSICAALALKEHNFASTIFPGILFDLLSNSCDQGNANVLSDDNITSSRDQLLSEVAIGASNSVANQRFTLCFSHIIKRFCISGKDSKQSSFTDGNKKEDNVNLKAITLALDALDFLVKVSEHRFSKSEFHKGNEELKSDKMFRESIGGRSSLSSKTDKDFNIEIYPSPAWKGRVSGIALHLDGIDIAHSCVRARRYTSGLFYATMFSDNYFGGEGSVLERLAEESIEQNYKKSVTSNGCYDVSGFGDNSYHEDSSEINIYALKLQKLLKTCFSKLQERDAVKGIEALEPAIGFKADNITLIDTSLSHGQNQNTFSRLLNLDSILQGNKVPFISHSMEIASLLKSMGLRHVLQHYLEGQKSIYAYTDFVPSDQHIIKEELFEGEWRSHLWDESLLNYDTLKSSSSLYSTTNTSLVHSSHLDFRESIILPDQVLTGFHENLCGLIRSLRKEDCDHYKNFLLNARVCVVKELNDSTMFSDLVTISTKSQLLNELEEVAQVVFSNCSPLSLLQQWGLHEFIQSDSCHSVLMKPTFKTCLENEEILYSVREIVLRVCMKHLEKHNINSELVLFSHMWNFCAWSQQTGNIDMAHTSFRRICQFVESNVSNCSNQVTSFLTPIQLQLEEANILMRGGEANVAIRKANLVVDHLKNKLMKKDLQINIQNEDSLVIKEGFDALYARALLTIGQWMTGHKMVPARSVLQDYLRPGVQIAEGLFKRNRDDSNTLQLVSASLTLAEFVANLYDSVSTRIESHEWKKAGEAAEQRQNEYKKCEDMYVEAKEKYLEAKEKFSRRKSTGTRDVLVARETELKEITIHFATLKKEIEIDAKERLAVEKSRSEFLHQAISSFGTALSLSSHHENTGNMSRYVFRMISLWFENCQNVEDGKHVNETMMRIAKKVPTYRFVPLIYQIFSRIDFYDHDHDSNIFQVVLREIIMLICMDHPYHGLVQLIALSNGNKVGTGVSGRQSNVYLENVGASKVEAAKELLEKLSKTRGDFVPPLIESYSVLIDACIDLAMAPTEQFKSGGRQRIKDIKLSEVVSRSSSGRETRLDRILCNDFHRKFSCPPCVLTLPPTLRPGKDYGNGKEDPIGSERIKSFSPAFSLTETGLHRPKIVVCVGSKGGKHIQLVKGEDDVRQDAIMQQVFSTVNNLLHRRTHAAGHKDSVNLHRSSSESNDQKGTHSVSNKQLKIATYNIIPLSPACGVIEWVNDTLPFGDYLKDKMRYGKTVRVGAHSKYYPGEWSYKLCHLYYSNAPSNKRREVFEEICRNFSPAFRFFFLERFAQSPQEWHAARMLYTRSCAVTSIVGHVLGIGDRHSHNILVHAKTGEVVHIDFGIVFEQGKCLYTPETVPFRLTRDIVDGMGPSGTEGTFSHAAEYTTRVLRENAPALLTILSAVVSDPLYKWSVSPVKARQRQMEEEQYESSRKNVMRDNNDYKSNNNSGNDMTSDDLGGTNETQNDAANRAISKISEKLQGYEEGTRGEKQSVEGQVQLLINSARDPDNLCRLYEGWGPWL